MVTFSAHQLLTIGISLLAIMTSVFTIGVQVGRRW